jgi:hypothetical protein
MRTTLVHLAVRVLLPDLVDHCPSVPASRHPTRQVFSTVLSASTAEAAVPATASTAGHRQLWWFRPSGRG